MSLSIFPEFNWRTEGLTPLVNPKTLVSELSGEAYTTDCAGFDVFELRLYGRLTANQKYELDQFWADNRGAAFRFKWCQDGETYRATFARVPVCLAVGTQWRCWVVLNRWPETE